MSSFNSLLDELKVEYRGRARLSKSGAYDDLKHSLAIGPDGVEPEIHAADLAIAELLRGVIAVVVSQAHRIRHLEKAQERLMAAAGTPGIGPLNKALAGTQTNAAAFEANASAFLARAMAAQRAGRISGTDVAVAEAHLNAGKSPPAELLRAVMAAEDPGVPSGGDGVDGSADE